MVWVCGTLSRQHHLPSMLLYDLHSNNGVDNVNNDDNENNTIIITGEEDRIVLPSLLNCGLNPIMDTLIGYASVLKEAELKGPSGLRDMSGTGGGNKDALQSVGLVPADYKLVHSAGRLDEQSILNASSVLQ